MTRLRRSHFNLLKTSLQRFISYSIKHRTNLQNAAFIGMLAGIIIAYSLPQTYTVEVVAVPKVTWERGSVRYRDNLMSLLSGNLVNNNPDDPDCFRPTLYPYIVASTPFLLRMAEMPVHTINDTTTYTLEYYVNHMQRTPWWNYVLATPSIAVNMLRNLFSVTHPSSETYLSGTDSIHQSSPTHQAIRRLSKQQLRTAGRIYRCLNTNTDKDKFSVTFQATLQDPLVAACVADSFRLYLQQYIQHYRDVKARRHLTYCDSLLQQARINYFAAQESLATYEDSHKQLNGYQNRQEQNRLRVQKNEAYRFYLQAEKNYREAVNRISAITPLFSVITPAEVPQEPDGPGRLAITLIITLLAMLSIPLSSYLKQRMLRLRYWKRKRRPTRFYKLSPTHNSIS